MDEKVLQELLNYFSPKLRELLKNTEKNVWEKAEEIHIAIGKPALIYFNGGFKTVKTEKGVFYCDAQTLAETLMLITENSIYAANNKLISGFVTLKGGHRAGVCGTAVMSNGRISALKDISSLNIRIKREIKNTALKVIRYVKTSNDINNTLIISPPRCGKTTLLRDISRCLGSEHKIAVIDERGEIAAMYKGVAQNDVGLHTDVIDLCTKHLGIPLAIRSMAPEIIITDEIGAYEDIGAINYAANCGVKVIASAHGSDIDDIKKRNNFKDLMQFFDVFIILTGVGGTGTVKSVIRRDEIDI